MGGKGKSKLVVGIVILLSMFLLTGCDLSVGDIIIGISGVCDRETLAVTKFEDSDDGICTEDDCSLREAVITANACAGLQDIDLSPGTYTLSIEGRGEDEAHTGDLDITDKVNLVGRGGMAVIDAGEIDRVLHIIEAPDVDEPQISLLKNLTITGGRADRVGGGILNDDAGVLVNNVHLRNNQAGSETGVGGAGGGFYNRHGHFSTSDFTVENNLAHGPGGGAYFEHASWLANDNQLFTGNRSMGGRGGGGIYFDRESHADIKDLFVISNETLANGGGVWNAGQLNVVGELKLGVNVAGQNGGGLYNAEGGAVTLERSWLVNNEADQGGGMFNLGRVELFESGVDSNTALNGLGGGLFNEGADASLNLRNVTVSRNLLMPHSEPGGGGIFNRGGDLQISYSTIAYNNADGLRNSGGSVTIDNSIIAHHVPGNCTGDVVSSAGFNLEDSSSCAFLESSDLKVDPVGIDTLNRNGGFSNNHALLADSPALNSANPADCPATDQRGATRPMGERCDRGSYESKEFSMGGSDTKAATAEPTPTPTATPVPESTSTPTVTPTSQEPTGTLDQNAFCRTGPGTVYPPATAYEAGTTLVIDGQNTFEPKWWRVVVPSTGGNCWISDALLTTTGPVNGVPGVEAPPTPTPTPSPVPQTVTPTYQQ